jgi:hypothetical protein
LANSSKSFLPRYTKREVVVEPPPFLPQQLD